MIKAELSEVLPNIFFLDFENSYNLAMCFLRAQEYYENPNPDFYRKVWPIFDFMEWYALTQSESECFSYPSDWSGFNVPGYALREVLTLAPDFNKYDSFMNDIVNKITHIYVTSKRIKKDGPDYYLIGAVGKNISFNHELAHGLYFTNSEYKSQMDKQLKNLPRKVYNTLHKYLSDMMYHESVIDDEMQAYLSTGIEKSFNSFDVPTYTEKFISIFEYFSHNQLTNE